MDTSNQKEIVPPMENLTIRIIAMPKDANPSGDMFGGWLISLMDMAGSTIAAKRAKGRVVTVAIDAMSFIRPVFIGDEVSCYASLENIGTSSIKILVEAWVKRRQGGTIHKVTEGTFTFVAIDKNRMPYAIPKKDLEME